MIMKFSTKTLIALFLGVVFIFYLIGVFWSFEPDTFDIKAEVRKAAEAEGVSPVVGYTTTTALIKVTETLLTKPGGYLTNDKTMLIGNFLQRNILHYVEPEFLTDRIVDRLELL